MAKNQGVQEKLRQELLTVPIDNPSADELELLPFLDATLKEVLRLHPPVTSVTREAKQDNIIPISEPVEDVNGNMVYEIQ